MTQKIFDINNEKDIKQLFEPLNEEVQKICYVDGEVRFLDKNGNFIQSTDLIDINCSNGTIITRPTQENIKEATKEDIGKVCLFWDDDIKKYGVLTEIEIYYHIGEEDYGHCRRLTKQEIEELC